MADSFTSGRRKECQSDRVACAWVKRFTANFSSPSRIAWRRRLAASGEERDNEIGEFCDRLSQAPGEIRRRLAQAPPRLRCDERKFGVGAFLVLGSARVPRLDIPSSRWNAVFGKDVDHHHTRNSPGRISSPEMRVARESLGSEYRAMFIQNISRSVETGAENLRRALLRLVYESRGIQLPPHFSLGKGTRLVSLAPCNVEIRNDLNLGDYNLLKMSGVLSLEF